MAKGDDYDTESAEENVYSGEVRENLIDGDEISPQEEAFMTGYDEAEEEDEKEKKKKKEGDEDEEEDEE